MRTTSYTPQLVSQLRAEYEAGKPARTIAKEHSVSRATTMRHLREAGVRIRNQGLSHEQASQAATMYRSGMTQAQIATHFGISQRTAGRCLHLLGVAMRPSLVAAVASR